MRHGRKSHKSRCCDRQLLCQARLQKGLLLYNALLCQPSHYHDFGSLHVLCATTQPLNAVTTTMSIC